MVTQQVNLYQPIFRKEKKLLSFGVMVQAVALVVVLLMTIYGWGWMQSRQMHQDLAQMQTNLDKRNAQLSELTTKLAALNNDTTLRETMNRMEHELVVRQKGVAILQNVRDTYTSGISPYLESFSRRAPQGVWLTGFMVQGGGDGLVLRGNALKAAMIPVFLEQLSKEPALQGTRFRLLQIERDDQHDNYVSFIVHTGNEVPESSFNETRQ